MIFTERARMKAPALTRALLWGLAFQLISAATNTTSNIRSIFLFKDVMKSNTLSLTTSGFNTLIIFNIGIIDNGDIMYYSNTAGSKDALVASNGTYVGGTALASKVSSFKTADTTTINRVEISMNSQHVRDLMRTPGPGATTNLYQNFAALKAAWNLDAVNNDDESLYDVSSTVAFGKMLGGMGYKYTISPYTNTAFWISLKTQLNKGLDDPLMDRVYLQCYDGGANNDPKSWQSDLGMKVVPLLWVTNDSKPSDGTTVSQAKSRFASWEKGNVLAGGGYWNDYDIEKMGSSYKAYGDVLLSVFP